jgi:hypothetical protein
MSPTSYRTAPPRVDGGIIEIGVLRVKANLSKINGLRKALIPLGMPLDSAIIVRFPSLKPFLPQ